MHSKLERKLRVVFSNLFKNGHPDYQININCGDGWYDLIFQTLMALNHHLIRCGVDVKGYPSVAQVKEKYGKLVIYLRLGFQDDEINKILNKAEKISGETCELCGSTVGAIVRSDGYFFTYCEEHAKQHHPNAISAKKYCEEWHKKNKILTELAKKTAQGIK